MHILIYTFISNEWKNGAAVQPLDRIMQNGLLHKNFIFNLYMHAKDAIGGTYLHKAEGKERKTQRKTTM